MKRAFQSGELLLEKVLNTAQASSNYIYIHHDLFAEFTKANGESELIYVDLNGFVFIIKAEAFVKQGTVAVSNAIRNTLKLSPTLDRPILKLFRDKVQMLSSLKLTVSTPTLKEKKLELTEEIFAMHFRQRFNRHIVGRSQEFYQKIDDVDYLIRVTDHELSDEHAEGNFGMLFEETALEFKSRSPLLTIKSVTSKPKNLFQQKFKFEDLGVGGMDQKIIELFRRAFAMRRVPQHVLESYGKSHVKGVLLFGPPGTGKTLIAKELAKCLNSVKPIVVNGPEILSKFVGESEENVRKLFAPARKDQAEHGADSPLHVVIFDEFDALAKPRGMDSDSTGVASNVVNQLLSMIDGVDSLNNILLIGMTNRKDLIDPAILRPGRFELHIEISLPDEGGRLQILNIHTKSMREKRVLEADVDLAKIAELTKNFTGAEIESLVKSAITISLSRNHDLLDFEKELVFTEENTKVSMSDFEKALKEVPLDHRRSSPTSVSTKTRSAHTSEEEPSTSVPTTRTSPRPSKTPSHLTSRARFPYSSLTQVSTILLYGPRGSGKTTIACQLAQHSKVPYIKVVSAEDMIGMSEFMKVRYIQGIFNNAYRSPNSLVIVDEIERILEYVRMGNKFSNAILQCLYVCLKKMPEKLENKICIIGTSADKDLLRELGLWESFNLKYEVKSLSTEEEIKSCLRSLLPGCSGIDSLRITSDMSINIKDLYQFASSVGQKLEKNPAYNIGPDFKNLLNQLYN